MKFTKYQLGFLKKLSNGGRLTHDILGNEIKEIKLELKTKNKDKDKNKLKQADINELVVDIAKILGLID